jgi:hypothetical protein
MEQHKPVVDISFDVRFDNINEQVKEELHESIFDVTYDPSFDSMFDRSNFKHEDDSKEMSIQYDCKLCQCKCLNLIDYALHLNTVHDSKVNGLFQCPMCCKTTKNSTRLKDHIRGVHLKQKVKCHLCDSHLAINGLRNHMNNAHNNVDRVNKPYKCDFCDFSSHADKYLKAHVMNCHETASHRYCCDQCDRRFPFPNLLVAHKEIQHEGKTWDPWWVL